MPKTCAAAEAARIQAEQIAAAIRERDEAERIARERSMEVARKAERDAGYAARKARQK